VEHHRTLEVILNRSRLYAMSVLIVIIALAIGGCSGGGTIEFIPDGVTYSLEDVEATARSIDISSVADVAADEIESTRQDYLTDLRGYGEQAGDVADTLTSDFPLDTLAVPVRVEAAVVDGQDVWLVFEAWAEDGGTLAHRRLWILDRDTLTVTDSMSFR